MIKINNKKAMSKFLVSIIIIILVLLMSMFMVYRVILSVNNWDSDINQLINRYQRLYEPLEKTECTQVLNDLKEANIITLAYKDTFEYKGQTYQIKENNNCEENCLKISNNKICEFVHLENRNQPQEDDIEDTEEIRNLPPTSVIKNSDFKYLYKYEEFIRETIEKVKTHFEQSFPEFFRTHSIPDYMTHPLTYLTMIQIESGSPKDRNTAFIYDPMQVANREDVPKSAKYVITTPSVDGNRHTNFMTDETFVNDLSNADYIINWQYSQETTMNANLSIEAGIIWLFYKGTRFSYDSSTDIIGIYGFDDKKKGIEDYNGGGDPEYWSKFEKYSLEIIKP